MTEGTSLDDLLNHEPSPEPETVTEPVAEAERPRDEHGRFAARETGVEPEPAGEPEAVPPTDKLPQEDYKAIREEREKRQNLEKELEALKAQIQLFQAQNQAPPPERPSVYEDEDAARAYDLQQALQKADNISRINASEMIARTQHPDFQAMYDLFNQMAEQNPSVVQQAMADPHPWGKAYQIAKSYNSMQELGAVDVNDLREKLKAEIMAELGGGSTPLPGKPSIPVSLTGERSVASRTGPAWSGPTSLESLLSR